MLVSFVARLAYALWNHRLPFALATPPASFFSYLQTLVTSLKISTASMLTALVYIQRFVRLHPTAASRAGAEMRVLTVALITATKWVEDTGTVLRSWEFVSGMPNKELVVMEKEFLQAMDWKLFVCAKDLNLFEDWVNEHCGKSLPNNFPLTQSEFDGLLKKLLQCSGTNWSVQQEKHLMCGMKRPNSQMQQMNEGLYSTCMMGHPSMEVKKPRIYKMQSSLPTPPSPLGIVSTECYKSWCAHMHDNLLMDLMAWQLQLKCEVSNRKEHDKKLKQQR